MDGFLMLRLDASKLVSQLRRTSGYTRQNHSMQFHAQCQQRSIRLRISIIFSQLDWMELDVTK